MFLAQNSPAHLSSSNFPTSLFPISSHGIASTLAQQTENKALPSSGASVLLIDMVQSQTPSYPMGCAVQPDSGLQADSKGSLKVQDWAFPLSDSKNPTFLLQVSDILK